MEVRSEVAAKMLNQIRAKAEDRRERGAVTSGSLGGVASIRDARNSRNIATNSSNQRSQKKGRESVTFKTKFDIKDDGIWPISNE